MWRRPFNRIALAAATHKGFGNVFDGTCTQVVAWMINKWRVSIIWRELYNVRDPPWRGDRKIYKENTVATRTEIVSKSKGTIFKNHSPWISPRKDFLSLNLSLFAVLISLIHYSRCPIHWGLTLKPTLYKFIVWDFLVLNPFIIWVRNLKPAPTIYIYIYIYNRPITLIKYTLVFDFL